MNDPNPGKQDPAQRAGTHQADARQDPDRPLTVAAVSFLNTAPLLSGLEHWKDADIVRAVPSTIAPMVLSGNADLGLASIVDFARARGELTMVPAGMIGCDGPTLTVRLFSSVPIESITRVHADTDSHTSVVLSDLILRERFGVRAEFTDYDFRERAACAGHAQDDDQSDDQADAMWPQTILMIGDKVVTGAAPAVRYPHQLDLGEAWKAMTGLPFVYAVWMCKSERLDDPRIKNAARVLTRMRLRNRSRLDRIVTDAARQTGWPEDLARTYIGELLRFDIDDRAIRGAERFLTLCADHGLLPRTEPDWAPIDAPGQHDPDPTGEAAACPR